MDIRQRRHSNKVSFGFGEDELDYRIEDGSGSRSFAVPYGQISRDRQVLVERNQWLRNVGLMWIALGLILTGLSLSGDQGLRVSFWLWIGLLFYGIYRFRSTTFTIVPTDRGNLLIIDDEDGKRVLQEIATRRAEHFRREYDFFPESESPEQHRRRFKWLHREGALSDEDLRQRLATVEAMETVVPELAAVPLPAPGVRFN